MALTMISICGMLALAVDAGRLYVQKRMMQNAVDAGALSGAQDLAGTPINPTGQANYALYHAQQDTFAEFNLPPIGLPSDIQYQAPSITQTQGGYTVASVAPTGYNNRQVQVTASYSAEGIFARVIGYNQIGIVATATAEAGATAKNYAVLAYGGVGTGSLLNLNLAGAGQIDNGQDGADACNLSGASVGISNAKVKIPLLTGQMNVNGRLMVTPGSDTSGLTQFWSTVPAVGGSQDPKPKYIAPNTSLISTLNPGRYKATLVPAGGTATVPGAPGVVLRNNTGLPHDYIVYYPGQYTNALTIPALGDALDSRYVFLNGVYWFNTGGSISITGGTISNTSTGGPHYVSSVGATDLPPAADGTDGVEFLLDGSSSFVATNTALLASSVFFVAPSMVQPNLSNGGGSAHIAFYVTTANVAPVSWTNQNFNATASNAPIFQVWGSVFDSSSAAGVGSVYVRAVQLGPHKLIPTDSDPSGQYAINGELIGYTMNLDAGSVFGSTPGTPPDCSSGTPNWTGHQGTPGLIVQYSKNFAPTPGANSYLVR
jgi:hypothetical protein